MADHDTGDWQGSIVHQKGREKLYAKVKGAKGWTTIPIEFKRGQELQARKFLTKLVRALKAGEELGVPGGAMTVRQYAAKWIERRKELCVVSWPDDLSRLTLHVLPAIGDSSLRAVEPRHMARIVEKVRGAQLAPRTVRNVYSVCKALFRDAEIDGLIDRGTSPCILTKHQLGKVRDGRVGWRASAVFTLEELELLISDVRVPWDRRVVYAVLFLTGLRHGEMAGLRWRAYDAAMAPLGKLIVTTSYDTGRTKTEVERHVPVHVTLAGMLAEWKLRGWAQLMGRQPGPDDLILPMGKGRRQVAGKQRTDHDTYKRLLSDLWTRGWRKRRAHDARRTFISLLRAAGCPSHLVRRITHGVPGSDVLELYTSVEWDLLCSELGKLKVHRRPALALAANADPFADPGYAAWRKTADGGGREER
jgi:integrase